MDPSRAPHSEAILYKVGVDIAEWFAMYPMEKSSINNPISSSRNWNIELNMSNLEYSSLS